MASTVLAMKSILDPSIKEDEARPSTNARASTLFRFARYYEATNNPFFLEKMRSLLQRVKSKDVTVINDLPRNWVLYLIFAIDLEPMTEDEAMEISEIMLGDEHIKKWPDTIPGAPANIGERINSIANILRVKKGLVDSGEYLPPTQTFGFIMSMCALLVTRKDKSVSAASVVSEQLKVCREIYDRSPEHQGWQPKDWIANPQVQLELQGELRDLKGILAKLEAKHQELQCDLKKVHDQQARGLDTKYFAADVLARGFASMKHALGFDQLQDRVEVLEQLGIRE